MARGGMSMKLGEISKETSRILRMVDDWPTRTKRMQAQFTYDMAERTRKEIVHRLPKGKRYKDYRNNFKLAEVTGVGADQAAYALHVKAKPRDVRKNDAREVVVYVQPRKTATIPRDRLKVLADFGPWTLDTLPFNPDSGSARIIKRRVSRKEVEAVRKARHADQPKWRAALAAAGAPQKRGDKKTKSPKRLRAMPDAAFDALRLEFGGGGQAPQRHWWPSLRNTMDEVVRLSRSKENIYSKAMTDPRSNEHLSWPTKVRDRVQTREAKDYTEFQDRLGLKLR